MQPVSNSAERQEFARFYRWGWLPLVGGTFALCFIALLVSDLVARVRGVEVPGELRNLFALRAFILSALVAAWAGLIVHRSRQRIERARNHLVVERAALSEQRRRLEQTEGVAAILRVMAHEIRNPLNAASLHAGVVRRALDCEDFALARDSLAELDAETRRLRDLVDEYLEHGRAGELAVSLRPIDLRGPVRAAVEAQRAALARAGIELTVDLPDEPVHVEGEATRLGDIVHKLLRNASEALVHRGSVSVRVRRDVIKTPTATLEITDSGPGFADPAAAFRPFYSTKPEGTGLGLSVVHDIVRAHRGEVAAFNHDDGGACVRIHIPLYEEPCSA